MHKTDFDRRDAIKSLLAISAASALAACTGSTESGGAKPAASASLKYASEGKFLNAGEMTLVAALAQTIIPKTDTAGAIEAGVPETIQGLASEWGDDNQSWLTKPFPVSGRAVSRSPIILEHGQHNG